MFRLLIATTCLLSAGCSSLARASEETQLVTVQVLDNGSEVAGVDCTLSNTFGSWRMLAPGGVTVRRSADELVVECRKAGASGRLVLVPKMTGKACRSIGKCGGIGFVINDRTGAGYSYPAKAYVELRTKAGNKQP